MAMLFIDLVKLKYITKGHEITERYIFLCFIILKWVPLANSSIQLEEYNCNKRGVEGGKNLKNQKTWRLEMCVEDGFFFSKLISLTPPLLER